MTQPLTQMRLKLDEECLKIHDQRIDRVRQGKLSLQAFCLTIRPDDIFVLENDTVYALSPRQWYALQPAVSTELLSKETFEQFLEKPPASITAKDKSTVDYIRVDAKHCPACRYQRHKETVWKLIKKYNYPVSVVDKAMEKRTPKPYPQVDGEIQERVKLDTGVFAEIKHGTRVQCLDCVEKHVSQAYVLACETLNGYADYLPLVIGHLCEAIDEIPESADRLKDTLVTCLAITNADRVPFVPLFAIAPLLNQARHDMRDIVENVDQTEANEEVTIDLTEEMVIELRDVPHEVQKQLYKVEETVAKSILGVENCTDEQRMAWEGGMATIGDLLAPFAPKTAAMVRARRLMFVADPAAAAKAGYSTADLQPCFCHWF